MSDRNIPIDEDISDADIEIEDDVSPQLGAEAELTARCKAAGIETRVTQYEDEPGFTSVALPSGREKRWIAASGNRLRDLLSVNFENFAFLSGYEAICSYDAGTVEAGLRSTSMSVQSVMRKLLGQQGGAYSESGEFLLAAPESPAGQPTFRVGLASSDFVAIAQPLGGVRRFTLKLSGLNVRRHDDAVNLLRTYANSLFFQIDMLAGSSFILERERRRRVRLLRRALSASNEVRYPTTGYEEAPISLYWYARTAIGMPLLQFLAFYQCIEFFYPTYSQSEAIRKVSRILKDPTFRADRDSDVSRLLSSIYVSRSGGIGDERSQLRATLNECLSAEEIREFFNMDTEREAHFSGKSRKQKFHKMQIANPNADLRNDVADRIYDIRCKIVHTKNDDRDGETAMLLPFTEDADYLAYDIELVQFVARSVLIASSSPL